MTPNLPELLSGAAISLSTPVPPEAAGDYMASRIGMVASICVLGSQEAERGPAACLAENAALRALFADAGAHDKGLAGQLVLAAKARDVDFAWSALDATNAKLRRLLIALHEAVEAAGDSVLDQRILVLYRDMAHWRRLDLPRGV